MIGFITLQTDSDSRRKVTISYSNREPEKCYLLGILPHNTQFSREDLLKFAEEVLRQHKLGRF